MLRRGAGRRCLLKNRRNYYRLLHVDPQAPAAVIKASYRAIMHRLRMHPDLGGDHGQAVLLNEAFETLSDPAKRAAYDRALADGMGARRGPRRSAPPAPTPTPPPAAAAAPAPAPRCPFCEAPHGPSDAERPDSTCGSCGSALCLARRQQALGATRRALERLARNTPVSFHRAGSREVASPGTTEDLSLNGMLFSSHVPVAIGERLRIECDFCSAIAVVKSVRPIAARGGASQYGVEFLTLRIKRERGGLVSIVA